ncbi:uncharacterized protein LOC143299758 isoform X2 [Babylonia areolata]|uniref:uncharacterized protein LOC143299758 isoform X2 n=1 Tax=Babylonia areolata TaxID=304850 RepID=UPI003FD45D4F
MFACQRPRPSSMTFWSRYDPLSMPRGNTDNWAKLRVRGNTYRAYDSLDGLQLASAADIDPMTSWQSPGPRFQYSAQGPRRVADEGFGAVVTGGLQGQVPGNLGRSQPSANLKKSWMDNQYHQRAKDNFRYWLINRPKPTSFGKYGMGSYKTVLGIGNAPRT